MARLAFGDCELHYTAAAMIDHGLVERQAKLQWNDPARWCHGCRLLDFVTGRLVTATIRFPPDWQARAVLRAG